MFDKQWVYNNENDINTKDLSCADIDPACEHQLPQFIKKLLAKRLAAGSFTPENYFNATIAPIIMNIEWS